MERQKILGVTVPCTHVDGQGMRECGAMAGHMWRKTGRRDQEAAVVTDLQGRAEKLQVHGNLFEGRLDPLKALRLVGVAHT